MRVLRDFSRGAPAQNVQLSRGVRILRIPVMRKTRRHPHQARGSALVTRSGLIVKPGEPTGGQEPADLISGLRPQHVSQLVLVAAD